LGKDESHSSACWGSTPPASTGEAVTRSRYNLTVLISVTISSMLLRCSGLPSSGRAAAQPGVGARDREPIKVHNRARKGGADARCALAVGGSAAEQRGVLFAGIASD